MSEDGISSFEDLEVWKSCKSLQRNVLNLAKQFPRDERYSLTDQLVRAARSVTANIAEGYGRFHFKENIQYCRQARGSLYEVLDHLISARDEGYITESDLNACRERMDTSLKLLNGYINYLRRSAETK